MSDVIEERINIQDEETDFESAISEGTLQRVAASINFINKRQYIEKRFSWNNELGAFQTDLSFSDGALMMAQDLEIIGYGMWLSQQGGTGDLEVDILRLQNSGDVGTSIFSTTPKLQAAAGSRAWITKVTVPTNFEKHPASGYVMGILSTTNLDQGDIIMAKLKSVPSLGVDAGFSLFLRPR